MWRRVHILIEWGKLFYENASKIFDMFRFMMLSTESPSFHFIHSAIMTHYWLLWKKCIANMFSYELNEYLISKLFGVTQRNCIYSVFINGSITWTSYTDWRKQGPFISSTHFQCQCQSISHCSYIFIQFIWGANISPHVYFIEFSTREKWLNTPGKYGCSWTKSIIMIIASVAIFFSFFGLLSISKRFLTESINYGSKYTVVYPMRNNLTRYLFIWMWWKRKWQKMQRHWAGAREVESARGQWQ